MRTRLYSGILAFTLLLVAGRTGAAEKQRVQVFILVGQSNMQGHGNVEVGRNPADPKAADRNVRNIVGGLGSLRRMVLDRPDLYGPKGSTPLVDENGKWRVRDDVWIWSNTDNGECGKLTVGYGVDEYIGPELGFGHVLGTYLEAPVLIVKTSWGGKDLAVDFRTPSAGTIPYKLGVKRQQALEGDPKLIGASYHEMLAHVHEITNHVEKYVPELAGRKMEIAGIGWHQGWNDGGSVDQAGEYEHNMAHFIRDVRKELEKPNLPFVIGGSGFGGVNCKGRRLTVLQAQLAMADGDKYPEFKGNVAAVDTRPFWREELQSPASFGYHWNHNGETHYLIGQGMGQAMVKLLQVAPQTVSQMGRPPRKASPNILFVLLDGESLMPPLAQTGGLNRQSIYFHYPNYAFHRSNRLGGAVRKGDYKLLEFFDDASVELYNLREDERETQDLAAKLPDVAESLRRELTQWRQTSGAVMPRRADAGQK